VPHLLEVAPKVRGCQLAQTQQLLLDRRAGVGRAGEEEVGDGRASGHDGPEQRHVDPAQVAANRCEPARVQGLRTAGAQHVQALGDLGQRRVREPDPLHVACGHRNGDHAAQRRATGQGAFNHCSVRESLLAPEPPGDPPLGALRTVRRGRRRAAKGGPL
jgi:hypothetical protein